MSNQFDRMIYLLRRLFSIRLFRMILLVTFAIVILPFVLFFIFRPKTQDSITYGANFSKKYAEELGLVWQEAYLAVLDDLGARNLRLIAYWDEVEAERDVYNFDDVRWQLDEAQKRGASVIMVIGRKVPRWPECFEPEWWKDLDNEEIKKIELYEYVEQAASALLVYDNIVMWQVENEPFFQFGICEDIKKETVEEEIRIVRSLDSRPILIQDSGEGGYWFPSYRMGDYLAISMYRKIWYDFWKVLLGRSIYFKYPLAHWTYKIKADLTRVPYQKIIVTELQAEPWGPDINSNLSEKEKAKSMSRTDFIDTINYAQKAGFKDFYFWGVEWWLWEKTHGEPYFWDTGRALFN